MSDPPPKKIGSLRDRIAAFEKGGASAPAPAPAPVPRPKPANVSWKPRATSPPVAEDSGSEAPEKKPGAGMSAADAKASIGAGGSLRERMAALQGRGAFGAPAAAPTIPPKPAGDKPKWKPPPRPIASPPPTEEGAESIQTGEPRVTSPPHQEEPRPSGEEESPATAEEKDESGEPDPEEEERQRRAAIAARMARLGGARVGMAPPIYGKKPEMKKPEVAKDELHKEATREEHVAEPTVSTPAEEPRSPPIAPVETPASEKTAESSSEYFATENASSTSLLSADSGSTPAPKSPAMPAPAIPRRAAPPRKKTPKSPAPPPAVVDIPVVSESPAPDAPPTPEQSEESKELQEAVKKSKEDEESLGLPPATLDTPKFTPPHVEAPEPSAETEDPPAPIIKEREDTAQEIEAPVAGETHHEEPEIPSPVAIVPVAAPPVQQDEEPIPEAHPDEPEVSPQDVAFVEEESAAVEEEPAAAVPVPAPVTEEPTAPADEEEDEVERRKRITERLRQQGGFNPFSGPPPPVRRPSEALSEQEVEVPIRKDSLSSPPLSPPLPPPRSASLRKGSSDSSIPPPPVAPERKSSLRQGSMDSTSSLLRSPPLPPSGGPLRSPPLPPASTRPERRSSVASTKSNDVPTAPTQDSDDEREREYEHESRARESVSAPIQEELEGDHPSKPAPASEWFDEPEEDDHEGGSHGHFALQTPSQASGFDAQEISPRSPPPPPPAERPPPPPKRTSLPPPPRRQSVPPPPRSVPPPPPPPAPEPDYEDDNSSDYGESHEDFSNAVEEQEPVEEPVPSVSPPARQVPPPPPPMPVAESEAPAQPAVSPRRQSSDAHPARRSLPPPPPPQEPAPASPEDEHATLQATPSVHPARRSVPPPPPPAPTDEHEDSERDLSSPPYSAEGFEDTYGEEAQTLQIPSGFNSQVPSPVSPSRIPPAISIPDQGEDELLDEGDVDPIDPSFYSPSKPTFSPSVSEPPSSFHLAPVETPRKVEDPVEEPVAEPPAKPEQPKAPVPEETPAEDEEQARRRTIAERMAKLGGIRFGAPMPPIARRPPPTPTDDEEKPAEADEDGHSKEPSEAQNTETQGQEETEEDEFARKQRIAARLASMGGMRFGMMPTPMAPPQPPARAPSQQSPTAPEADEGEAPPPPPPRTTRRQDSYRETAPSPPSTRVEHESESSPTSPIGEYHGLSPEGDYGNQSVSDYSHVDEQTDIEEISHEEAEETPPPVPNRPFRRESAPSPETTRPPVPMGRPPVPPTPTSPGLPQSAPPSRRPPVPVSSPPPPPPPPLAGQQSGHGDFVMVEAPEEAPPAPPPRSASLRRPPPRSAPPPPPAPVPEESETPTPEWGSSVNFGADTDLSLSGQWSEDSTQYPPTSTAPPQAPAETQPARPVVPEHLSADELMAQWGRIGVQIHEIATTLFEKSKKSLVGDGTYIGFVNTVLREVPNAVKPLPPYDSFGYLIYEQSGPSVHKRASDIMPGDIIVLQEAKLKGHKGIQIYHQHVGADEPLFAIIGDFELKKSKVKVFQANQRVGQESVESVSYRLEDLKTGLVKIFRVLEA